jgi:hypothetical protein
LLQLLLLLLLLLLLQSSWAYTLCDKQVKLLLLLHCGIS